MKTLTFALILLLGLGVFSTPVSSQSGIDRDLLSEISKIKAIDNHAEVTLNTSFL